MATVLIDNYDSFTWNVYQYLSDLGAKVQVFRNDQTTLQELIALNPRNIVISPGVNQSILTTNQFILSLGNQKTLILATT